MKIWGVLALLMVACGGEDPAVVGERALQQGDLIEAERRFRSALDESPDRVDALYGLGWVYHLTGASNRARDYFMRCLRLDSNDHRGFKGLGSLALSEGNFQMAEKRFQEALERAPGDPAVTNSLALSFMGAARYEEAVVLLEELVQSNPSQGELGLNLAEGHFRMKNYEAAMEVVAASLEREIAEVRFRALLHELRARILVRMTSGRLNAEECATSAPPLLQTLDLADQELETAAGFGVELPNLNAARLRVHRRRSRILEECPAKGKNF
ncbi:MAG: tetratricopeptide repeat protein [Myxococcota bacterium]|jgi:tetratricopeptide (TPR) repeat protein|nr:tetratricopeptide repeat protein [Myxococcota bacterium]MEC7385725.1 tetratricopeptide repeat protein [Planctomycetota bacterium]